MSRCNFFSIVCRLVATVVLLLCVSCIYCPASHSIFFVSVKLNESGCIQLFTNALQDMAGISLYLLVVFKFLCRTFPQSLRKMSVFRSSPHPLRPASFLMVFNNLPYRSTLHKLGTRKLSLNIFGLHLRSFPPSTN